MRNYRNTYLRSVLALLFSIMPCAKFADVYANDLSIPCSSTDMSISAALQRANVGDAMAQLSLGMSFLSGVQVGQNYNSAFEWLSKAAMQDVPLAQLALGILYAGGKGVQRSSSNAFKWTKKAAENNLAMAQRNIGKMYHRGFGIERDDGEAVRWWRMAAEQGDVPSQSFLGTAYFNGTGTLKDDNLAALWWNKAAIQGDTEAQTRLGAAYCAGDGVSKNLIECYALISTAASAGDEIAVSIQSEVEKQLTVDDIAKGKDRAKEWQATYSHATTRDLTKSGSACVGADLN
jgi:TPR repeat protein